MTAKDNFGGHKPRGFLNWLLGRSDIVMNGSTYMRRWQLIDWSWFGVRIHNILRSDEDRALHDHPWWFVSLILWGGYFEHRPRCGDAFWTTSRWHGPGSLLFRRALDLHRIELGHTLDLSEFIVKPVPMSTWTLVIRGREKRRWGFMTKSGWQDAKTVIFDRNEKESA